MKLLDHEHLQKFNSRKRSSTIKDKYWNDEEHFYWVIRLFVLTTMLFAARVAMPVCATAMAKEFGWSKADLGAVMGSFFWGYVTTQILGGYIADRISGDKVLCVSVIVWGSLTLLTPYLARIHTTFGGTLVLLTFIRVFLGISQGVHYPSMMSLLARKISDTHRTFSAGIITAAANFGTLTCGGIGSLILLYHKWDYVFYVVGIVSWLCACSLISTLRRRKNKLISIDSMVYSESSSLSNEESVPWKRIFTKSPVWALIFVHFCMNNCFYILLSWLPSFFHDFFPEKPGWVYNVIPWAMSIPFNIFAGWVSDRLIKKKVDIGITRKIMEAVGLIGASFFSLLLPLCSEFLFAVVCAGLAVSTQTFHTSGALLNPQDITPKYSGSVFGVMNTFGAIPGFLGVYITGYILNTWNSWMMVFSFMCFVNLAGLVVYVIWGTGQPII